MLKVPSYSHPTMSFQPVMYPGATPPPQPQRPPPPMSGARQSGWYMGE